MQIRKSQLIIMFLVGFAAATMSNGAPMVLMVLVSLVAVGLIVGTSLDLTLEWKPPTLAPLWKHFENSESPEIPRQAFLLGVGHRRG